MDTCSRCPRKCGAHRPEGYCLMPENALIARAEKHFYEEPCICSKEGSGTIFFCGCNLKCVFCQNEQISRGKFSDCLETDAEGLAKIMKALESVGCCNINLVTPSHYTKIISEALSIAKPGIPVVWNSGGYDSPEEVESLGDKIDIFMPDFKYASDELGRKYSGANNYYSVCTKAIEKMARLAPKLVYSPDGLLKKGLIIRHLVLPGNLQNTFDVIDCLYDSIPRDNFLFSLMGQYTPPSDEFFQKKFPELSRPLSSEEYEEAKEYMRKRKLNGFIQFPGEDEKSYIPKFGKNNIITADTFGQ